jgi:regulator of protease activity HflC (stomatin/prohibitin superfamily)
MAEADAPYSNVEARTQMLSDTLYVIPAVLILAFVMIQDSMRILREYERAVVSTLGRFQAVMGPGLMFMIPFVQKMVRVDLRIQVVEIPSQDLISRDNVSMRSTPCFISTSSTPNAQRAVARAEQTLKHLRWFLPGDGESRVHT